MPETITSKSPRPALNRRKNDPTLRSFMRNIDFSMLRDHKKQLLELGEKNKSIYKSRIAIEGVIALIDHIQDTAVDQLGYKEKTVFGELDNEQE